MYSSLTPIASGHTRPYTKASVNKKSISEYSPGAFSFYVI